MSLRYSSNISMSVNIWAQQVKSNQLVLISTGHWPLVTNSTKLPIGFQVNRLTSVALTHSLLILSIEQNG